MQQCTTSPQKRRRTQESLIREGGKSDAVLCIKLWKRCRRTTPDLSIREFAKRIGEEESTVRNILNKGTTAGRLTYWLPDQKKRGYFDLSPAFAAEETRRRASNKGPRGKISNHFMRDFAKEYRRTIAIWENWCRTIPPVAPQGCPVFCSLFSVHSFAIMGGIVSGSGESPNRW